MICPSRTRSLALLLATLVPLTACSLLGEGGSSAGDAAVGGEPARVVLVTHESFSLPKKLIEKFEQETGYDLVIRASGDAGTLTNKLVLSAGNPQGDLAFGVDNTFASRALENDVFASYSPRLPAGAEAYALPGDDGHMLTPVDNANVCVNIDKTWFDKEGLAPPQTLEDLADPAYRDLYVLPGAASSSPGLAFLLATVAAYGDEWPDYWTRLLDNGAKLTADWTDAYTVDFTQGGGHGDRPVVLSYDSSPAFTVDGDRSTTTALLDTCFRQVEYAGVLDGAANPEGAEAVISWLLTDEVQSALPTSMYVFPVDPSVELPQEWATYAVQPDDPFAVDPAEIAANRDEWLTTWSDVTSRWPGILRLLAAAAVPLAVLGVFFALPVAGMVSRGFWTDGSFDPGGVIEVLGRPRVHRVLWFTLWSASLGTLLSLALGLPAAHVLYRRRLPGARILRVVLLTPFVLPTVVVGVAFRQLVGESGPLGFLALDGTPVAIVAGLVFFNAAVVIRVVGGAWESLDPRPAEAAAALGASPSQVLRTVTLPALRPAIVSAASVVFLFCATAFGVVLTLGGLRYSSVETEIYLLTTNLLDLRGAAALSVLQLVVVTGLLLAAARARRTPDPSLARVVARPRRLSRVDLPALAATGMLALLVAGPILALVVGSLRTGGGARPGWTLDNYRALATTGEQQALLAPATEALATSLRTAVDATWMAVLLGLVVGVVATRRSRSVAEGRVRSVLDGVFMLPLGVSAVTLGFGFLVALDEPPLDLRDSPLLVPVAQALVALPLVVRILVPVLASVDDRLRQAAATLGAPPWRAALTVDLPVAGRPLLAAAGFAFAVSLGEFGATSFLARDEHPTLPVVIFGLIGHPGPMNYGMALAASVVLAATTAAVMLVVERLYVPSGSM